MVVILLMVSVLAYPQIIIILRYLDEKEAREKEAEEKAKAENQLPSS